MNFKKVTALVCALVLAITLSSCGQTGAPDSFSETGDSSVGITSEVSDLTDVSDMFSDRDLSGEYDASTAIAIGLSDNGSTCESDQVSVSGNTITISGEGIYLLSGTLSDGQIIVDADGQKVQLVLDNATISNFSSAAIYIKQADKVFLTLADASSNTLSSAGEFVAIDDNNIDAAIFSKADFTLNGSGTLTVECATGHGIVSKDDLCITGGTYTVTSSGHALCGKDSVRISSGTFSLTSGKDGIHSENTEDPQKGFIYIADGAFTVKSTGDGLDASSVLQIDGGIFDIGSGCKGIKSDSDLVIFGGDIAISKSYEGLEGMTITINDGNISLYSDDDGLNAAGGSDASRFGIFGGGGGMEYSDENWIVINGGTLYVNANGDGIDSNGNLTINNGAIYVDGPTSSGDAPIDWAGSGIVNGGTLIAVGSSGMAESFSSECTQGAMLVSFNSSLSGDVVLSDSEGNALLTYTASKTFNCVMLSCADILQGSTYTVTCGSESTSVEMTDLIYGSGNGMGGGFGGGRGGARGDKGDKGGKNFQPQSGDGQTPDGTTPPADGQLPDGATPPADGGI